MSHTSQRVTSYRNVSKSRFARIKTCHEPLDQNESRNHVAHIKSKTTKSCCTLQNEKRPSHDAHIKTCHEPLTPSPNASCHRYKITYNCIPPYFQQGFRPCSSCIESRTTSSLSCGRRWRCASREVCVCVCVCVCLCVYAREMSVCNCV